jgi:fatty-acyl-CoA synthase
LDIGIERTYRRDDMHSIGSWLDHLAEEHGEKPAVLGLEERLSYRELAFAAERVACGLAELGVSKGTRVGLLMPNSGTWLAWAFGALELGALVVPLNTLWRLGELEYALRHADVTVLVLVPRFLGHDYAGMLRELCPVLTDGAPLISPRLPALRHVVGVGGREPSLPDAEAVLARGKRRGAEWLAAARAEVATADPAAIFFTSGSTATPKGVVHTHGSMLHAAANVAGRLGLCAQDRTWAYLPFFFTGGLVAVAMGTLSRGGGILVQDVFDAGAAIRLMTMHDCTTFFAWPHQAQAIASHPDFAASGLRLRKGPGANAPWAEQIFAPGHQAVGTWGMTETGPMATCSRYDDPLAVRAGAHGRPMPGMEVRIADASGRRQPAGAEGELCVRGSSLMAHYYKSAPAECFDAEGFFHTGDLAVIDSDGLVHFRGRIKDVIKTAGVNVAAADVEAALQECPGVRTAYVTGVPHAARGENIAAFVVRSDPACGVETLREFCRQRLASYKVPRHIFFCGEDELPQLGSGKVDKQALRRLAIERIGTAGRGP